MINNILPIILGIFGLLSAYIVYLKVKSSPEGTGKVKEIGDEIHLGAMVFMASEYKRLAVFCLVCIIALFFSLGWETSLSFFVGATCSGVAGFIGFGLSRFLLKNSRLKIYGIDNINNYYFAFKDLLLLYLILSSLICFYRLIFRYLLKLNDNFLTLGLGVAISSTCQV